MTHPFASPPRSESKGDCLSRQRAPILSSVKAGAAYFSTATVIGWLVWATVNVVHNHWHPIAVIVGIAVIPIAALSGAAIGGLLGLIAGLLGRAFNADKAKRK